MLQAGRMNNRYRIGADWLAAATDEKDLGVWIRNDLKPVAQCGLNMLSFNRKLTATIVLASLIGGNKIRNLQKEK